MTSSYDDKLLEYYLGKSVDVLNQTHSKYKCYAEKLSKKCEATRQQIDELYQDLKTSKRLYQNALIAERIISREKVRFERVNRPEANLPWCSTENEELDDEIAAQDVNAELNRLSNNAKLQERLHQMQELMKWMAPVYGKIVGSEDPNELETAVDRLDTYPNIDQLIKDVTVRETVEVPSLQKTQEEYNALLTTAQIKQRALSYFVEHRNDPAYIFNVGSNNVPVDQHTALIKELMTAKMGGKDERKYKTKPEIL